MDMQALKKDFETAMGILPKDVIHLVAGIADKVMREHRTSFEALIPFIGATLMPHAKALMMEMACGVLDRVELESTLTEALGNVLRKTMQPVADGTPAR